MLALIGGIGVIIWDFSCEQGMVSWFDSQHFNRVCLLWWTAAGSDPEGFILINDIDSSTGVPSFTIIFFSFL